jgi:hypothetical protein
VSRLWADVNDLLSGIEPAESEMKMILDGKQMLYTFQPIKQRMYYDLLDPLDRDDHTLEVWVKDRTGNETEKRINFKIK